MTSIKLSLLKKDEPNYMQQYDRILAERKRKTAQYIGEGFSFFMVIAAGAIFVYRSVKRQLKTSQQQQNFMMAITHELKTPIAVSKLNLETLQKRKLDEAQQQKLVQSALQEANRMNALCNNMLLSSQIDAGGYKMTTDEINISDLVHNCTQDFTTRFPQRLITENIEQDLFSFADTMLMQMVINNLLDNALKYSPKETTITVNVEKQQNKIYIRIADNGPGIDDTEKKKIFDKFYRLGNEATKRAKGTGLGLYLVKRIIKAHNGDIYVNNNQPGGAVFVIELEQAT